MMPTLFGHESPRPAALMRIGVGLVLLWDVLGKWPYLFELYSTAGLPLPLAPGTIFDPQHLSSVMSPALYSLLFSPVMTAALYSLLIFALLAVVLGWKTRVSLVVSLVLFTWFGLLDMAGSFKKFSVIGQHLLLLLAFTESHAVWSIDARLDPRTTRRTLLSPCWPRTLLKCLISFVYLGAAITKIRMIDFGSGDLLSFSLLDDRWGGGRWGMWLAMQPKLVAFCSTSTALFELVAAVLLWFPQTRRLFLILAIGFHAALAVFMHLQIFSPMMTVALIAFLQESDLQWLQSLYRRIVPASGEKITIARPPADNSGPPLSSWVRYVLLAVIFAAVGESLNRWSSAADLSGVNAKQTWIVLDQNRVQEIREGIDREPQPADYLHRFNIGTRLGFFQVFGNSEEISRGETLYALARFQPTGKAMTLTWVLIEPDSPEFATESDRVMQRIDRELRPSSTYSAIPFALTDKELPLGKYTIVLEVNGDPVARKSFRLMKPR